MRIVEDRGNNRRITEIPLDKTARESFAKGLCQYLNIKSRKRS